MARLPVGEAAEEFVDEMLDEEQPEHEDHRTDDTAPSTLLRVRAHRQTGACDERGSPALMNGGGRMMHPTRRTPVSALRIVAPAVAIALPRHFWSVHLSTAKLLHLLAGSAVVTLGVVARRARRRTRALG